MNEKILDSGFVDEEFVYWDNLTSIERLKSMLLDHVIICFIILPIFMIPFAIGMESEKRWINETIMLLLFGIYLNKDFLQGRSAAKRILGQVVVDKITNKPANELKCAIRNFTDILWIIEVVIVVFSPSRRIGDLIATTKVVRTEKEEIKSMWQDFKNANKSNWILSLGIAIFYIWIIFNFMDRMLMI